MNPKDMIGHHVYLTIDRIANILEDATCQMQYIDESEETITVTLYRGKFTGNYTDDQIEIEIVGEVDGTREDS